jgi:hypothetical protein
MLCEGFRKLARRIRILLMRKEEGERQESRNEMRYDVQGAICNKTLFESEHKLSYK